MPRQCLALVEIGTEQTGPREPVSPAPVIARLAADRQDHLAGQQKEKATKD